MKNLLILLLVTFFSFCACKKENKPYIPVTRCPDLTRNIDTINTYIQGEWEWVEERRYDRDRGEYVYYTAYSPGWYHLSIKLNGDTVKLFVNGLPDSTYQFKIQRLSEITNYPLDSLPVLVYYSFYTRLRRNAIPIMICKDQLLMQYQIMADNLGEDIWMKK